MQLKILQYAYQHYLDHGAMLCYIDFLKFGSNTFEVKNTLQMLENEGYIGIPSFAIGAAYVKLTDYGLSYCEEIFS